MPAGEGGGDAIIATRTSLMKKAFQLAVLVVFLTSTVLAGGGGVPGARTLRAGVPEQGAAPQPQQPTFRVQVDYVEVDVVVTDRQGNLVRDLKKEDFQVFEDGKPQSINTFTFVDIPIERADRPLFAASPIEPDVKTNERAFNARNTLQTLKNVAEWFASVHGRRKTILLLSEGIDYDINDLIPQGGSNHRDASMILDETRDAIAAATRANVSIYGIDPRGLTDLGDESIEIGSFPDDTSLGIGPGSLQNELRLAQDSLRVLSDETGGFAVVNRNDFSTAFDRVVQDNSSYYVLAYYPPDPRPGRAHKIEVRTTRPGLTIRARKGYVTPKQAVPEKVNTKDIRTPEVRGALDSPLPVSGLTMHVFAAPFKGTAPNASILLGVELRGRDLQLTQNGKIQLSYLAIDAAGKVRGGNTDAVTMGNLRPETKTRIETTGLRLLNRFEIPPGRYQLRVAAHDSNGGNVGSVQYDLDVPDFAKTPFSISGVALTSITASQLPTAHPDEQTRGVLPAPPAATRPFPQ